MTALQECGFSPNSLSLLKILQLLARPHGSEALSFQFWLIYRSWFGRHVSYQIRLHQALSEASWPRFQNETNEHTDYRPLR